MTRIKLVSDEEADDEYKEIFRWGREMAGTVPNHFRLEANSPVYKWISKAEKILWDGIGNLSPKVVGHIFVAISLANNCTYCAGAGCSVLAGRGESKYSLKYRTDEAKLRAFLRDVDEGDLDGREKLAVKLALKAHEDPHSISEADLKKLRENGYTDMDLLNIVHMVDVTSFSNRTNIVFDTDYDHLWPLKDIPKNLVPHIPHKIR